MMTNDKTESPEVSKGGRGTPSKQALYQKTASYAMEAVSVLAEIMKHSDQDSNRVGAAKIILAKCLPDLKSSELGDETRKIMYEILTGQGHTPNETTNPQPNQPATASNSSDAEPAGAVQSLSVGETTP